MNKKKTTPLVGVQREKLLIALQLPELVGAINLAMKVRRLSFTLDWEQDIFPGLYVSRPDVKAERFLILDPRKRVSYTRMPSNKELFSAVADIQERLFKNQAKLMLVSDRVRNGPRVAKLQLYCEGATHIALTMMEVRRGHTLIDTSFSLPDGTIP